MWRVQAQALPWKAVRQCTQQAPTASRMMQFPTSSRISSALRPSLVASSSTSRSFSSSPSASFVVRARLDRLKEDADAHPSDSMRQYKYLKELCRVDPSAVVERVQSGEYASNAGVQLEYTRAMQSVRDKESQAYQSQYDHYSNKYATSNPSSNSPYATHSSQGYAQQQPYHAYAQQHGSPQSLPNAFPQLFAGGAGTIENPLILRQVPPRVPWMDSFLFALPKVLLTLGVFGSLAYFLTNTNGGGGMFNPFGTTKDFLNREMSTVRFTDVKGCDEAKGELQEVVEFLKNPAKFERLGGKMTKGILLTGPPGTGKTLLAKAVAGEAGVAFFAATGSEFDEMFIGVGASRIRELFAAARKQKRAIIFIDEIDAVGASRDRIGGSQGRATINALLTEMDGFSENSGIIVIGATNHEKILDAALVRPGRFDRTVAVSLPDAQGRFEILQHYAAKLKLHSEVDLRLLSQTTSGFSGADLQNLLNGAALRASAQGKNNIDHDEVEYAYDKLLMGAERSFTQSKAVKANTAYHEAGHTIMLLHTPGSPELHKVTILPRGRALGAMFHLPQNEHRIMTKQQILAKIDICMGGRVAEEFLNGKDQITSGASNDLEQASAQARSMVTQFGMGVNNGIFTLPQTSNGVNPAQVVSPETLRSIDDEVSRILKDSYERAKSVISTHRVEWERLSQALIEHEALDAKQVMQAVRGENVTRKIVNKFRPASESPSEGSGGLAAGGSIVVKA